MAHFQYQGVDQAGGPVSGRLEAADRRSAMAALSGRGYFPTDLAAVKERSAAPARPDQPDQTASARARLHWPSRRVNSADILAVTSQLSTALRAGLPLHNCLEIIERQQHKPAMKEVLVELAQAVSSGDALSTALARRPRLFGRLYQAMVRVGETGGILEQTTTQLTGLLSRENKIKSNMKNAATYPLILLTTGLISVIIVITWILPNIVSSIVGSGAILPWPTRMLMAISAFVVSYGWLVTLAIVAATVLIRNWIRTPAGQVKWDAFKLSLPVFGPVQRAIAVGRFARTLGALTGGGVTILEALAVVRDTLGNEMLGRQIDTVAERVKTGEPLAEPLAQSGSFPPLLVQIVSVGEQTGKLDELLLNAADTFDDQADTAITRFMTILPALLVLLLAVVIGFIVAATLLPIVVMELGMSGI